MKSLRLLLALTASMFIAVQTSAQIFGVTVAEDAPRSAMFTHKIAPNVLTWQAGPLYNTRDLDCFAAPGGPSDNYITGEYCEYYGDPQGTVPQAGSVYYVGFLVQNVAPCAGVAAYLEGILPANTSLAVSAQNPVVCLTSVGQEPAYPVGQCPQALQQGTHGGYKLNPTGQPTWSLGHGAWVEIHVPLTTSVAGAVYFKGFVLAIDGWNSPTDTAQVGIYVNPAGPTPPPAVTYPARSADAITDTTAATHANLLRHNTTGNVYTDMGNSDSYGYTTPPATVTSSTPDPATVDTAWSALFPGTTYHWRQRYVPSSGPSAIGLDQVFTTTGVPYPTTVIREDFNYDSRSDLIVQNTSTGAIAEWTLNNTANAIASGAVITTPGAAWKVVATGFFNYDKYADLVLQNTSTGDVVEWQMNGTTIIAGATIGSPGVNYKVIATGDFNGDGYSDIVMQNTSTNAIAIWLMNGVTLTGGAVIGAPGTYKVVTTGDFNGDGRSELLLQDSSTGAIAIWQLNAGGTALAAGYLLGGSNPWKAITTGDVNQTSELTPADLKSEIILQNSSTGDIAVWKLNAGGTAISAGYNLGGSGTVWKLVGTGDYDGDSNSDLILQNTTTGDVARWQLNSSGTAIATGAVFGSSGTSWTAILN